MLPALLLATLIQSGAGPAPAAAPASPLYAALPLRNLTADASAAEGIAARLRGALEARGARFVPAAELETLLRARRIRYTDSLSAVDAAALRDATGASCILAGVLFESGRTPAPRLSVALRVLDAGSGRRVQSALVSLHGEDFRGLLGLGAIDDPEELAEKAVQELLESFGPRGAPLPAARGVRRARDEDERPADARRRPWPELDGVERVVVMPFGNRSSRPEAGLQFSEVLAHEWFAARGIEVVESAELRDAMVRARVRYLQEVDLEAMAAVGRAVGARYFVFGSVERYGEQEQVLNKQYPVVEATVRLVDAEQGSVAAAAGLRRRGDESEKLLGLGALHNVVLLARATARGIIAKLGG